MQNKLAFFERGLKKITIFAHQLTKKKMESTRILKKWAVLTMMTAATMLTYAHPLASSDHLLETTATQSKEADEPGQSEYWKGLCFFQGYGMNQDFAKAVKMWKKAAKKGHVKAMFSLGYCYANGVGVDQDYDKAKEWYLMAAEENNADAQYNLGLLYVQDKINDEPDGRNPAEHWFRKAAEQGHVRAANNLAYCYAWGIGMPVAAEEAIKWLYTAARQGNWKAKEVVEEFEEEGPAYEEPRRIRRRWP